ncbi:RING-H2 finger protein ATL3 [Spatholobus suberectus]|nr:RING-H2 finger protein ATL3 [Spatholobus suberectus]
MDDSSAPSDKLGESPAVEVTGKIMVVIIIIMFFVVVIALCLHLFARGFWWRDTTLQSRSSRRRGRRFVFSSGEDGALRTGLDPSVLSSLPVLVFEAKDFKDGLECAVCLSEVVEGEKARLLPKCNHGFHVDCIDMWFQSHSTCPLCRNPVASSNSNSNDNSESESPTFPTNVLVWGDHTQISSTGGGAALELEEGASQPPCSSSAGDDNNRRHGTLVIDIPSEITSTSLSPSASRFAEDDLKSPMTGRLRSLKRLLSRDRRLNPWSPTSADVEQPASGSGHT